MSRGFDCEEVTMVAASLIKCFMALADRSKLQGLSWTIVPAKT